MLGWGFRFILFCGLLWGHLLASQKTLFVGYSQPQGIEPITQTTLPLSADDIARGLLAHPTPNINSDVLRQAHETRYILSQQQDELRRIQFNQQQKAIQLLQTMDQP